MNALQLVTPNAVAITSEAEKLAELREMLTRHVTAFETWAEFVAAMKGGYAPTIRVEEKLRKNASDASKWDNNAKRVLREMCRQAGFPVFDGRTILKPYTV